MKRRALLFGSAVAALLAATGAHPQSNWRRVAVPAYAPPAFVDGAIRFWFVPRADEFVRASAALAQTLQRGCGGDAQVAWRTAVLAWVRLSAVAIGPLVERRSARRIDFQPTRPESIARAIALQPDGEAALEGIGSAAKGFAALEWLLWPGARKNDAAACRYAAQLGLDIAREAEALHAGFVALRERERDDDSTVAAMTELVNQWIGGLEQLRLHGIVRPLGSGRAVRGQPPFPRPLAGIAAAEREARWQTLRTLALFDGEAAPAAGEGLVPLETYLRGKGLNPLADRWRRATLMAASGIGSPVPATLQAAARRLASLKTLAEGEVAPALDVRVGFSDADGD